jgi:uncharacterized protein (TIGR03435 family)
MHTVPVTTTAILAVAALLATATPRTRAAQGPGAATSSDAQLPQFVASIKRNRDGAGFIGFRSEPAGRTMTGVPLRQLIVQSYGIQPSQLIGGPDWLTTDRWDIQLRADSAVTPQQVNALMQQMLADRFKLVVHRETRELPVFELRLAREDGKPGPELEPAAVDCSPQGRGRPGGPPPPAAGPGGRVAGPGVGALPGGGCMMMMTMGRLQVAGQPLSRLTDFLSNQMGRPVIDKTGLTGSFDLTLSWTPDGGRGGGFAPPPGLELPPIDPNGPPLVTALQEQLGLKVESVRGPIEVLVIDSVQQPTEN